MTADQMDRASGFLKAITEASRDFDMHVEDVGGHDKRLSILDDRDTPSDFLGSTSYLRWNDVDNAYEIEAN